MTSGAWPSKDGSTGMARPRSPPRTRRRRPPVPRSVEIDFSRVDYINSTGIALVVRLLAEARRDGRVVQARGLSQHYREVFTITRLSDFMSIIEDEEEAPS